jgi:chemotaxis protein CheD
MNISARDGHAALPARVIHVVQGEFAVSKDADVVMSTVLGSCVAACLFDPLRGIGGINHFLLPNARGDHSDIRFAAAAMEQLLNALLKKGALKSDIRAKLFGGAKMIKTLPDIGRNNGLAALEFLRSEEIPCLAESLGGTRARRLRFFPNTGRAQIKFLGDDVPDPVVHAALPEPRAGEAELF